MSRSKQSRREQSYIKSYSACPVAFIIPAYSFTIYSIPISSHVITLQALRRASVFSKLTPGNSTESSGINADSKYGFAAVLKSRTGSALTGKHLRWSTLCEETFNVFAPTSLLHLWFDILIRYAHYSSWKIVQILWAEINYLYMYGSHQIQQISITIERSLICWMRRSMAAFLMLSSEWTRYSWSWMDLLRHQARNPFSCSRSLLPTRTRPTSGPVTQFHRFQTDSIHTVWLCGSRGIKYRCESNVVISVRKLLRPVRHGPGLTHATRVLAIA